MSLVLKYFKRKLKPFKQCVDNQSNSFDLESEKDDKVASNKKPSQKFNINLIKRKRKASKVKETENCKTSNNNKNISNNSVAIVPNTLDNSFGEEDDNEIERKSINTKHQQTLFNTPVSSMCSIDDNQAPSRYCQMIIKSTDHEYLLNSSPTSSCYTYNVPTNSCSSYEETNCFGSIINSTPTNSYASSMITKYVDEDGLLSVSVLMLPQSQSVKEQQSTPFTENYAKIKCLKKDDQSSSETNTLKKCRRSNTTYTIAGSKTNNQIIDYFNKLELSKPIKKQAVIRKLNENNKKVNDSFESTTKQQLKEEAKNLSNANEVEKIQDVLFYDEPSMLNENNNQTNENNTFDMSLNNNAGSQNEPVLDSTTSSIKYETDDDEETNETKNLIDSRKEISLNNENSKSTNNVRLNETHLVNLSIEKIRRSLSFPVLQSQSGSPISANSSKISFVKECDISNEKSKSQEEESQQQKQPFVRGDPQTRVSKNIKQMFKNVVKYQMNALNSLEKFYETQIAKFDLERKRNLAINPNNAEKINQYFDAQIKLLEDRVHANLKVICENKSQQVIQEPVNSTNNKSILSRKLSQVMMLKQLEIQQKKSVGSNSATQRLSRSNLKANLLAMNQNNILPSKKIRNASSGIPTTTLSNNNFEYETADLKETIFKRNLSLPYHQCKQSAAMILNKELTERINSNNNLRLARRLESSQSNRQSTTAHSLSTVRRDNSNNGFQSNGLKANHNIKTMATSYQKNNVKLRQQSTSNENVSSANKLSTQSINIKRQNKSQLSLKSSPTNEHSVISNIQSTNESSLFNAHDTGKFSNSSNFSITLSKSNCSLFSNNGTTIFDSITSSTSNSTNNSCHLIKYQPPRFSDSHIQFRLNQQKLALLKSAQEFKKMSCLNNANSNESKSKTITPPSTNSTELINNNFFKIETQV
jgi:hypothetical protein